MQTETIETQQWAFLYFAFFISFVYFYIKEY